MRCEEMGEDQWKEFHSQAKSEATTCKAFDALNSDRHDLLMELQLVETAERGKTFKDCKDCKCIIVGIVSISQNV